MKPPEASEPTRTIDPFHWLVGSASLVVVIAGLRAAQSLVVPFLVAAFLAVICTPALQWLQRKRVPAVLAILLVVVMVSLVVLVVVAITSVSIADFISKSGDYQRRLVLQQQELVHWLESHGISLADELGGEVLDSRRVMRFTVSLLGGLSSAFSNAFLVLLTVLFMLLEASGLPQKMLALAEGKTDALQQAETIREAIVQYISLKTSISLLTGLLVGVWVWIAGVDYPVLWGMLAFFFNYIPNIGSILAAVPAVILALIQHDLATSALTAAGYAVINIVIGNIIEPRWMGQGLGLSTLVVFVSLVFWGWVLGPVGMLFSVPLTMIVKIVMERFDETRWLAILLEANPARS